jgi:hypothetical protein
LSRGPCDQEDKRESQGYFHWHRRPIIDSQ